MRSQYSLGYTPDRADLAPGYHKITVKTKLSDLSVQARAGYYFEPHSQRAQKLAAADCIAGAVKAR